MPHDVTAPAAESAAPRILELASALRHALAELYPNRTPADHARVAIRLAGKAQPRLAAMLDARLRAEAAYGPVGAARVAARSASERRMADARECYRMAELQSRHDALAAEVELLNEQLDEARRKAERATGLALSYRAEWRRERNRTADLADMLAGELRAW